MAHREPRSAAAATERTRTVSAPAALRSQRRHREPTNPWVERSQAAALVAFVAFVLAVLLWFTKGLELLPMAAVLPASGAALGFAFGPQIARLFQFVG